MRERVQCICIRDNKILFVKDKYASHYYPPGGSLQEGETHLEAMKRELQEEIKGMLEECSYYFSYEEMNVVRNVPQIEHNYFVTMSGEFAPSAEVTDLKWYGWEELRSGNVIMPPDLFDPLIIKLHEEGYF